MPAVGKHWVPPKLQPSKKRKCISFYINRSISKYRLGEERNIQLVSSNSVQCYYSTVKHRQAAKDI